MHDGVKIIEEEAFQHCESLKRIHLLGVKVIEEGAFADCTALEDVEFGNELDKIGWEAFARTSLRKIKIPKVRAIEANAFVNCEQLTEAAHLSSEDLESVEYGAFMYCLRLRRIAIPLKNDILDDCAFSDCDNLTQVDLVGGIHKTISSLHLGRWRDQMNEEIDSTNQVLYTNSRYTDAKTAAIQQWIERVLRKIRHYKRMHYALLKEAISLLELALWKANLIKNDGEEGEHPAKKTKIFEECRKASTKAVEGTVEGAKSDVGAARRAARVTCGAGIIIKNVLPFLNDDDVFPLRNHEAS